MREYYDKLINVTPKKLDNLLSEAISKGTKYATEKGFLNSFGRTHVVITR